MGSVAKETCACICLHESSRKSITYEAANELNRKIRSTTERATKNSTHVVPKTTRIVFPAWHIQQYAVVDREHTPWIFFDVCVNVSNFRLSICRQVNGTSFSILESFVLNNVLLAYFLLMVYDPLNISNGYLKGVRMINHYMIEFRLASHLRESSLNTLL